tara:strand:+ start:53 stop:298 length:246 start_codon:yes stop_codon:yes gene_type:complete
VSVVVLSFFKFANKKAEGEEEIQKKQISGFYERGKKEEVLTSDEKGDEKKREISKSKTNLPKIRSPSLLSWRERVCVCARV